MLNDRNAKKIKFTEEYPNGANSPTYHTLYECACGNGTVEYVTVPGFDDTYVLVECDYCREHYKVRTGCGYYWELIAK